MLRVREFAAPLQALLFIVICLSLVWMLYAMAFYDPTPPTMDEVNSDVTQDPQINDMRTAAAQTVNALFGFGPTQIFLVTSTPSLSPTVTPTMLVVANTITPRPATFTSTAVIEPTWTDDRTREDPPTSPPTPIPPTFRPPTATFTLRPPKTATNPPPTTPKPPTTEPPPKTTEPPPTDPPTDESPTEPPVTEEPTGDPEVTGEPVISSTQALP